MANQVIEENGKYFTMNPSSKNVRELKPTEIDNYLLNKKILTPNEIQRVLNEPIDKISNREIASYISGGSQKGDVDESMYDNKSLVNKAMVDLAYHRGATTTNIGPTIANPARQGIDIPPQLGEGLTGSDTFVSEDKLNSFEKFTADQGLKTQKIINDYDKNALESSVFDYGDMASKLENLDSPFKNINPEFLETLHNVSKSDVNFTGINSGDDVIDAMTRMINDDAPLASSNYSESLEILDGMVVDNLRDMGSTLSIIETNKVMRDVVQPITNQMKKFAGKISNTISSTPEKLAGFMAGQDPVTNEIPGMGIYKSKRI